MTAITKPRLSIGLMVYNGEDYLADAIQSLLGQTFGDFELVIGDNASTDRTEEICRDFASRDARIRYVRRPENVGATRNARLLFREAAAAPYFKFAAHDDFHALQFLERCVDVLDRTPEVVLCHTGTTLVGGEGEPLPRDPESGWYVDWSGRQWPIDPASRRLSSPRPHQRYHDILHETMLASEFWGVMRRDALEKTRLLGDYFGSDRPMLARLALIGPFHVLNEPLFYLRRHPSHATSQSLRDRAAVVIPGGRRKRQLSSALVFRDFGRAIAEADLSLAEKARCMRSWLGLVISRKTLTKVFVPGRYNVLGIDFGTRRSS
jgi:glycosyltransferase involved in cell wall biosynthesis